MAEITLITGGCRSGKSSYAQRLAESSGKKRLFIATAPILDEEMRIRIAKHKEMRQGHGWDTKEETLNLDECLQQANKYDVVLCDCLTLWVNNLMYEASKNYEALEENDILQLSRKVCNVAKKVSAQIFFVTNEVGMGIVPADKVSRKFRDLMGRCNQEIANAADSVFFMASGISIQLKGGKLNGNS